MCENAALDADLRVSIQIRGSADRVRGHQAVGILTACDAVAVPDPPQVLRSDAFSELEALIIPVPTARDWLIERFPLRRTAFYKATAGDSRLDLATLTLHGYSRYAPQLAEYDAEELAAGLDRTGSWWAALSTLNLSPPGIDELPDAVLEQAGEVERRQYKPQVEFYEASSLLDLATALTCPPRCKCPKK